MTQSTPSRRVFNQAANSQPRVTRFHDQRWVLDNIIQANGMEWDQGRLGHLNANMGPEATGDIQRIRSSVKRFSDIAMQFAATARKRLALAKQAEILGRMITARENFYMAAGFFASAQWPLYENSAANLDYNTAKRDAYLRYAALADHRIETVWIDVAGQRIPAWFHLPYNYAGGKVPAVVSVPGMDEFKERSVSLYGDRWLNRGVAVLAIEAAGQYEAPVLGVYASIESWADTGRATFEWLAARPEIDADQVGIIGNSFGSFISTIAFSHEPRFAGCAATMTCREPGHWTIFDEASPTFKMRFMYMSGLQQESEFDEFRRDLTWQGHVEQMKRPYLCIAGEEDQLSPLRFVDAMFKQIKAPKVLMIYQGGDHAMAGAPSALNGPFFPGLVADWMMDRFERKKMKSERLFVQNGGAILREPFDC